MAPKLPDRVVAPALALASIALYLGSALGRAASESGQAELAREILGGRLPPSDSPVAALFVVPFLTAIEPAYAQAVAAAVAGGLSAAPTYLVLRRIGAPAKVAFAVTAFAIAGSALWYGSVEARDAYVAQSVAVLFATFALLAAVEGRPAWLVGLLLAAAALSRAPVGLAAFGLAIVSSMYRQRPLWRSALFLAIGFAPFIVFAVNVASRWIGALGDGTLYLGNIPRHVYAMGMQAPEYVGDGTFFVRPLLVGTSLLLTSPVLVYAVAALRYLRSYPEVRALALAAALPLLATVLGADLGAPQFGYRLVLDTLPFLLPLAALGGAWSGTAWGGMRWTFIATVLWSIAANLYGLIAVVHLGVAR